MSQKFQNFVAKPENVAKELRQLAEKFHPIKKVRSRRNKKNVSGIKESNPKLRDAAAIMGLGAIKWSLWLTSGGAQLFFTLTRWLMLDNEILRKMENAFANKKNVDINLKKKNSFTQKYPNLSAHILWLFGLSLLSMGVSSKEKDSDAKDELKEYKEQSIVPEIKNEDEGTYKAFLDKMRSITPFVIADLILKEGVHIDTKSGLHTPYLDSQGIPTIGFGSTILKDGSRVTMNTKPITTDEAYELARWHLEEGETYFVLYCYDVSQENVNIETTNESLGMSSIIYNSYSKLIEKSDDRNHKERFAELRKLYNQYGYALSDSMVCQVFKKYPIRKTTSFGKDWLNGADKEKIADNLGGFLAGGRGIYWRRWLEAGLLTGNITPQMLLDCPINGMYEFFLFMGERKNAFFTGDVGNRKVNKVSYDAFKKWLLNPVNAKGESLKQWEKVGDFLPTDILAFCKEGKCEFNNKNFKYKSSYQKLASVTTYTVGYDEEYKNAMSDFIKQDYKSAAIKFEKMIKKYPNNALLHNDLAATYNHLGRYNDAIEHARKILHTIGDKSQYGSAQYNAGFAYEQLGDFDRALKNYKLAAMNGNESVFKDIERVSKLKNKKNIAFYDAASKINQLDITNDQLQIRKENNTLIG